MTVQLRSCLWFEGVAEDAAQFYVGLLPDSEIENILRASPGAPAVLIDFTLAGAPYQALNGGRRRKFSEASSIALRTDSQTETDRLWQALTKGGSPGRCGWLKDRYGLSWQIVPHALSDLMGRADPAAAQRISSALLGMGKIDIAVLEKAFNGESG